MARASDRRAGEAPVIFNSLVFIEFALGFFLLWPIVRRFEKIRYAFLIVVSCVFYGYAGWWFVPLLLVTATLDFYLAQGMERFPERKKALLWISLISNLGALSFFKYLGFFESNVQGLLNALGIHTDWATMKLILPVGISFYTFQSLSYVFDVYAGRIRAAKHVLHFLSIVSLFAHLVAGPIVRIADILPQMSLLRKPTHQEVWAGVHLISFGFFKKMVLADTIAPYVDSVYRAPLGSAPSGAYFLATLAFTFQIYYDFSGYTDIARGLAKWIGLEFTLNFNDPYTAVGIRDFWTRWHISLSSWIRDYVYIPLGGSRKGEARTHLNQWIAMVASGFWHGANWTFVMWGVVHAFYTSLERLTRWPERLGGSIAGKSFAAFLTFWMAAFAWIFFRAADIHQAWFVCGQMLRFWDGLVPIIKINKPVFYVLAFGFGYEIYRFYLRHIPKLQFTTPWPLEAMRAGALLFACVYFRGPGQTFIYFQF